MAAIEEVRNGKSALEASKMYRIPSRTLYDKLQKIGLTSIGRQQPEGKNPLSQPRKEAIPSTKDSFQHHLAMENFIHGSRSAFDAIDTLGKHTCMFCGHRTRRHPDKEAIQIRTLGKFSCHKCNERFHLSREIAEAPSPEAQTYM